IGLTLDLVDDDLAHPLLLLCRYLSLGRSLNRLSRGRRLGCRSEQITKSEIVVTHKSPVLKKSYMLCSACLRLRILSSASSSKPLPASPCGNSRGGVCGVAGVEGGFGCFSFFCAIACP